jgi:hypothetical protein
MDEGQYPNQLPACSDSDSGLEGSGLQLHLCNGTQVRKYFVPTVPAEHGVPQEPFQPVDPRGCYASSTACKVQVGVSNGGAWVDTYLVFRTI